MINPRIYPITTTSPPQLTRIPDQNQAFRDQTGINRIFVTFAPRTAKKQAMRLDFRNICSKMTKYEVVP